MSAHPDDAALQAWLVTGRPTRVERHLDACGRCLGRVEELSALDPELRTELDSVTAPPGDMAARTGRRVQGRLAAQEALSVVAELFALPWRTLDALVDETVLGRGIVPSDAPGDDDAGDDGERRDG